jgi:HAD superfamily hydrolase (TIGR01509 family)
MSHKAIKAVFVDLGGVLVLNHSSQVYEKYNKKHGINSETFRSVFKFAHSSKASKKDIENYLKKMGLSSVIWESFKKDFFASEIRNDSLYELLSKFKQEQSVLVFFTTNNGAKLDKVLKKYNLLNLSDHIINSSLISATKPDARFWQFSYKEVQKYQPNIQKKEIMVIDDSSRNIDSAKDFGFQTLLYKTEENNEELREQLLRK